MSTLRLKTYALRESEVKDLHEDIVIVLASLSDPVFAF